MEGAQHMYWGKGVPNQRRGRAIAPAASTIRTSSPARRGACLLQDISPSADLLAEYVWEE
eukprot:257688-Chlamydomonas_euryale.AAC.2